MRYCSLERMRKTLNSYLSEFYHQKKNSAIKIINFQGTFKKGLSQHTDSWSHNERIIRRDRNKNVSKTLCECACMTYVCLSLYAFGISD